MGPDGGFVACDFGVREYSVGGGRVGSDVIAGDD